MPAWLEGEGEIDEVDGIAGHKDQSAAALPKGGVAADAGI
jgi:hypothetical protein